MSKSQWVLVECVSTFRTRYMVEVPTGRALYALDTVVLEEAKEFSQEFLGEKIFSHRVIPLNKALALCDEDNDYTKTWNTELKVKNFFTNMKDQGY